MGSRQETKEGTTVKDQWDLYRLRPSMGNSVLRVGGGGSVEKVHEGGNSQRPEKAVNGEDFQPNS